MNNLKIRLTGENVTLGYSHKVTLLEEELSLLWNFLASDNEFRNYFLEELNYMRQQLPDLNCIDIVAQFDSFGCIIELEGQDEKDLILVRGRRCYAMNYIEDSRDMPTKEKILAMYHLIHKHVGSVEKELKIVKYLFPLLLVGITFLIKVMMDFASYTGNTWLGEWLIPGLVALQFLRFVFKIFGKELYYKTLSEDESKILNS